MDFVNQSLNETTKIVKMEMTQAETRYAEAALAVFKRYGARKATMEEIAIEAGVSKPTLYATFRNKDAALAATIRFTMRTAILAVKEAWQGVDDLEVKLESYFELVVLSAYDTLRSAPDPDAFYTSIGESSAAALRETNSWETALLAEALSAFRMTGSDPERYASFVVTAATQAKHQISDRDQLLDFLSELKLSALAVVGVEPS